PPAGAVQTWPQEAQLAESFVRFLQAPPPSEPAPQTASPPLHEPAQVLVEHSALPPVGALQTWPQPAQLAESFVRFLQAPPPSEPAPHTVSPAPHEPAQVPLAHSAEPPDGALQTCPQVPQLAESFWRFLQAPPPSGPAPHNV